MTTEKTEQPSLAELEAEGYRLHHCIASEGIESPGNHDRGPVKRKAPPPKTEDASGY